MTLRLICNNLTVLEIINNNEYEQFLTAQSSSCQPFLMNLHYNQLHSLKELISLDHRLAKLLPRLVNLTLSCNKLTSLAGLAYCTNLTYLNLNTNHITDISKELISSHSTIQTLLLKHNNIEQFSLFSCPGIQFFPNLTEFDVTDNNFTDLHQLFTALINFFPSLTKFNFVDKQLKYSKHFRYGKEENLQSIMSWLWTNKPTLKLLNDTAFNQHSLIQQQLEISKEAMDNKATQQTNQQSIATQTIDQMNPHTSTQTDSIPTHTLHSQTDGIVTVHQSTETEQHMKVYNSTTHDIIGKEDLAAMKKEITQLSMQLQQQAAQFQQDKSNLSQGLHTNLQQKQLQLRQDLHSLQYNFDGFINIIQQEINHITNKTIQNIQINKLNSLQQIDELKQMNQQIILQTTLSSEKNIITINQLNTELEKKKQSLSQLHSTLHKQAEELRSSQAYQIKLKESLNELKLSYQMSVDDLANCKLLAANQIKANNEINQTVRQQQTTLQQQFNAIESGGSTQRRLEHELKELRAALQHKDSLLARVTEEVNNGDKNRKLVEKLQFQCSELKEQLKNAEQSWEAQRLDLNKQISEQAHSLQLYKAQLDSFSHNEMALNQRIQCLKSEQRDEREWWQLREDELLDSIDKLQQQREEADEVIKQLNSSIQQYEEASQQEKAKQLKEFDRVIAEVEGLKEELQVKNNQQIQQLQLQLTQLHTLNSANSNELNQCKAELSSRTRSAAELAALFNQLQLEHQHCSQRLQQKKQLVLDCSEQLAKLFQQ
jgi:hypothetical protein